MLIDTMIDRKLTTIISSHNLKEINEICDSVALIHKGKVIFNRDLDDVKGNIHKVQIAFDEEKTKEDFSEFDMLHFEKSGSILHLIIKGEVEEVKSKLQEKNPIVLDIIPMSLEEIFIYEMEGLGYDCTEINE